jgi:hypothetical protein
MHVENPFHFLYSNMRDYGTPSIVVLLRNQVHVFCSSSLAVVPTYIRDASETV